MELTEYIEQVKTKEIDVLEDKILQARQRVTFLVRIKEYGKISHKIKQDHMKSDRITLHIL